MAAFTVLVWMALHDQQRVTCAALYNRMFPSSLSMLGFCLQGSYPFALGQGRLA